MYSIEYFAFRSACDTQAPQNKKGDLQGRQVSPQPQESASEVAEARLKLQNSFSENYTLIMKLNKSDINNLKVENGKLILEAQQTSPEDRKQAVALIQQTYRQTWGGLVDAHFGHSLHAGAMQKINNFKDHLIKICPEGSPTGKLQGEYEEVNSNETKNLYLLERGLPKLPEQEEQQRQEQVTDLAQQRLDYLSLKGMSIEGINPSALVFDNLGSTTPLAVRKEEQDVALSTIVASTTVGVMPNDLAFLGGFNETLASHLNIIMGGRLGIPLATHRENKSHHAYVEHKTHLWNFLDEGGNLNDLPLEASQRFIFAALILLNSDQHGKNILITESNEPVPIDMARILYWNYSTVRGSYFAFPCLDQPINQEDKEFYANLDVAKTVGTLRKIMEELYPEQFQDKALRKILNNEFDTLKAQLYTVQIGVQKNLTQRQILALYLPPLSEDTEDEYWARVENKDLSNEKKYTILCEVQQETGAQDVPPFIRVMRNSYVSSNGTETGFDEEQFKRQIGSSLDEASRLPQDTLWTPRESYIYNDMGFYKG